MPDDLWLKDSYAWSLQQAERLRRLRAGERVNDLDWDNIIEEIESVGQNQVDAVRSHLIQAVAHLLKARSWPDSPAVRRWRQDATNFLAEAQDRYRPSMAQALDLPTVYRRATKRIRMDAFPTAPVAQPRDAIVPLAAVADGDFTLEQLEAALFPPG
jgi:hypothetical protein